MHGDPHTVVIALHQSIEPRGHGLGLAAVAEKGNLSIADIGVEAEFCRSFNEDAVAGKQFDTIIIGNIPDVDGMAAILNE